MGNGNAFIYGEKSSCASLQSSKTDYEQRTETIDIRPTPGTAPGTCLSAEVSYFFCQPFRWAAYFGKLETKDVSK